MARLRDDERDTEQERDPRDPQQDPGLAPLFLQPLQGMPPMRPVESMATYRPPVQPLEMPRPEPPPPPPSSPGILGSLRSMAQSDTGRSLLGALAVGLSGLRNPQDQGRFQESVLANVTKAAQERSAANAQQEAMQGLLTTVSRANELLAAGRVEEAAAMIGQLTSNPMVLRNPQSMQIALALQQQLGARAGTQRAIRDFRQGLQESVPAQPARLGGTLAPGEDPEAAALIPRIPGTPATSRMRAPTGADLLGLLGTDPALAESVSKIFPKQSSVPHWDSESQKLYVFDPGAQTVTAYDLGGRPKGLKLAQITGKSRVALEGMVARSGTRIQDWLDAYNSNDPQALDIWRQATEEAGEADLKSEAERSAKRELDADIEAGKVPKPTTDTQYQGLISKQVQSRAVGVAGAKAYAGERNREEAELEQSPMRAFRQGGGIIELASGQYRDVTRNYTTMREANEAQKAGKATVIYNVDQYKSVQAARNTLNNFKNIREIGNKIYARDDLIGILKQGGLAYLGQYLGTGPLGSETREMMGMMATAFDTAKALGNDSRVSDADVVAARKAQANETWFSSKEAFNKTLDRMEGIFKQGLSRAARDERWQGAGESAGTWEEITLPNGTKGRIRVK